MQSFCGGGIRSVLGEWMTELAEKTTELAEKRILHSKYGNLRLHEMDWRSCV